MAKLKGLTRLWKYLKVYRKNLFIGLFLTVIVSILSTLEPIILGWAITELTQNVMDMARGVEGAVINVGYVTWVLVVYWIRGMFTQVGMFGANVYFTRAVQDTVYDLRQDVIHRINHLPVKYFDNHAFGDILDRLTSDMESVSNAMQQTFSQLVNALIMGLFVLVGLFYLDWKIGWVVIGMIVVSAFIGRSIVNQSQTYFRNTADTLGEMNGYIQEQLTGFDVVKLYGREEQSAQEYEAIVDQLNKDGFRSGFTTGLMQPLLTGVTNLTYLAIAYIGAKQTILGALSVGNLQAVTQYVWRINQPIQVVTQLAPILQSASAATSRIFEILDEPMEDATVNAELPEAVEGSVTFDEVDFRYVEDRPLIEDLSIQVEPGEMIAIVGPTGAGKTTIINLLMRFYDVTEGSIQLEGRDIRDLDRRAYRENFGMVLQDAWLFSGTIKENLRFGNLEATDDDIVQAAKLANVDHFIRTLPGGYEMEMNEESSNISLGQKQLLTIARALLSDPKILILDEATSSVDTRLEQLIQKAMNTLMEGRTSFVIAHRLSTIQGADRILVMDQGRIIEQGNHEALLAQEGFYYNLYNSQFAQEE